MMSISIGNTIPDFESPATGSTPFKLSDYRGRNLILYFYPRDNTPGCTQEGKDFATHYQAFQDLNCSIFGVSRDSLGSHEKFKTKQAFPFELLADPDETLCKLFDVIKLKNMYGKQVLGIERSTFLINTDSILTAEWRKIRVKGHVEKVLETLQQIQND